ncbi:helix-turn-helix domain-containing protein [Leucobacter sp. HY1910]
MPRRIEDYRGLTQLSRVKLMHAIQRRPGRLLAELAEEVGIHINTARDHVRVLEAEGLITSRPVATGVRGRPPVVFDPVERAHENPVAAQRTESACAQGDMLRKIAPHLDQTAELPAAAAHQVDTLYTHLEDVGLEPQITGDGLTIDVAPCKFAGMLEAEKRTICSVHATLVRDQLTHVDGPLKLGRLSPFVTEDLCRIELCHKLPTGYRPTGRAATE